MLPLGNKDSNKEKLLTGKQFIIQREKYLWVLLKYHGEEYLLNDFISKF